MVTRELQGFGLQWCCASEKVRPTDLCFDLMGAYHGRVEWMYLVVDGMALSLSVEF
jgi:hypothetical protein